MVLRKQGMEHWDYQWFLKHIKFACFLRVISTGLGFCKLFIRWWADTHEQQNYQVHVEVHCGSFDGTEMQLCGCIRVLPTRSVTYAYHVKVQYFTESSYEFN